MYNLRRSSFLQVFNASPDETAFHRVCLYRETVPNMLLMIQPSLLAYSMQEQPQAVLLDIASVNPNRILLLDSFFIVLVFYGEVRCRHPRTHSAAFAHLPSDCCPMAQRWLPASARVRFLCRAAQGWSLRCRRPHARSLPRRALHRVRPAQLAGACARPPCAAPAAWRASTPPIRRASSPRA